MGKLIALLTMSVAAAGAGSALAATAGPSAGPSAAPASGAFQISPQIGLSSFVSLCDGHLQKMADSLAILAQNDAVRTGNWEQIRGPLQQVAKVNVEAVNWFALPNGDYWTLQQGKAGNISSRPFFPQMMSGQTVIGPLVVSQSTGEDTTIVSVPVYGTDGKQIGALGASVYLDKLSQLLRTELGVTHEIFFSFDSSPLIAVNWDPALIFTSPTAFGPELTAAVNDMLTKTEGTETYSFRGQTRTVVFRKSQVTGWWYVFGIIQG